MLPGAGVEDIDALLGVIGWMVTPGARLMLVNAHFILSDQYHDTTLRLYDQVANDSMRTLLMTLSRESLSPVCSWCPCPFPHALIFTASQRIIEIFPTVFWLSFLLPYFNLDHFPARLLESLATPDRHLHVTSPACSSHHEGVCTSVAHLCSGGSRISCPASRWSA